MQRSSGEQFSQGLKVLSVVKDDLENPSIEKMCSVCKYQDDTVESAKHALEKGACDYLVKPISQQVVNTIWHHVGNRRLMMNKDQNNNMKNNMMMMMNMIQNKGQESTHEDIIEETKKHHLNWTPELHYQFLNAIKHLGGLDDAVPKDILQLMNVPYLTRKHVASHLQKYKIEVKRRKAEEMRHEAINLLPMNSMDEITSTSGHLVMSNNNDIVNNITAESLGLSEEIAAILFQPTSSPSLNDIFN